MSTLVKRNPTVDDILDLLELEEYVPIWDRPEQIDVSKGVPAPDISTFNAEQAVGFSTFVTYIDGNLTRVNPADGKTYPVDMLVLMGVAGTGKSYLVTKTVQYLLHRTPGLKIAFLTPTHQAGTAAKKMSSLASSSKVKFSTIHSVGGVRKRNDQETGEAVFEPVKPAKFEEFDIVFIDEAGMTPANLYMLVKTYAHLTRFIWTGDPAQLPPVGEVISKAYEVSEDFAEDLDKGIEMVCIQRIELTQPMRAALDHPVTSLATRIRKRELEPKQTRSLVTEDGFRLIKPGIRDRENGKDSDLDDLLVTVFASEHYRTDSDYCTLVTWTNKSVGQWNRRIRRLLYQHETGTKSKGSIPVLFEREFIKLQEAYVIEKDEDLEDMMNNPYYEPGEDYGEQIYANNEVLRVVSYEPYSFVVPGVNITIPALMCTVERHEYGVGWIERTEVPVVLSENLTTYRAAMRKLWTFVNTQDGSYREAYWNLKNFGPVQARYSYCSTTHKIQGCTNWINILDAKNISSQKYFPKDTPEATRLDGYWRMLYTAGTRPKKGIVYLV